MLRVPYPAIALALIGSLAMSPAQSDELKDLYYGEALYYARQGLWFDALERLDTEIQQHDGVDEPELDPLYYHIDDAEFALGDFELRYRMHNRAGRAFRAVLEGDVDELVRNDAAYRLARLQFQKGQYADAQQALARIQGKVPAAIRDDVEFLRANILLAEGQPAEAANILKQLQDSDSFGGFAAYNYGIALLQDGQLQAAREQLDKAGRISSDDPAMLAIRDKSNLVLGTLLMEDGQNTAAGAAFNRVRLDGPFANQALLSAGWAAMSTDRIERAVVPWSILAEREVTDAASQEAMLALPYAYGKLDVHGRAATLYGRALDSFGVEVDRLNESIDSIRDGKFLEALVREEIRHDKDWVIRLRAIPQAPETFYLMDLLATHDFQTGLQNYLDLADLRKKFLAWQWSLDSFDDMVAIRHDHYEPLLPGIDQQFRELDSRLRLRIEQHRILTRRLNDLLTTPRPEFLATREEHATLQQIEDLESRLLNPGDPDEENLRQRLLRVKGALTWTLETEYHARLTRFDSNLRSLNEAMAIAHEQNEAYIRARQAATHSYVGYDRPVERLRVRVRQATQEVERLMARQGHLLEVVAIEELVARRSRLENYRDKARFALADSYDRATQAQARRESAP